MGRGMGAGGYCICPRCGTRVPHRRGVPCYQEACPSCGAQMTRDMGQPPTAAPAGAAHEHPHIDLEKCLGCGECAKACPFDAVAVEEGKARILEDRCRGCRVCVSACPVGAIS